MGPLMEPVQGLFRSSRMSHTPAAVPSVSLPFHCSGQQTESVAAEPRYRGGGARYYPILFLSFGLCCTYQVCAAPVERFPSTKRAFLVLGTRFFPFPSTEMAFLVLGPTFIPTLTVVMADLIGHLLIPGPNL